MGRSFRYLIFALILTAILILHHQFDGLNNSGISYVDEKIYHLVGKHYEGKPDRGEWESLYAEMRSLVEKEVVPGVLTIVWYNDPEQGKGKVKAFIGIITSPDISLPEGLVKEEIYMRGVIRASNLTHPELGPAPPEVTERMRTFALEKGYELQDILIEKFPGESPVITEIPVR